MTELQFTQPNYLQFAQSLKQLETDKANQNYLQKKQAWEEEDRDFQKSERNYLLKKRETDEVNAAADRAAEKKAKEFQIEALAISTALKAGNQDQANQIYKNLGGKAPEGVKINGKDVSIEYGDSTFKGPASVVSELVDNIGKNPDYIKNPQTWSWFAANGGSIEQDEQTAPQTRTIQNGREKITQEYDPVSKSWKEISRGPMDKDPTGMEITTADGTVIRTGVPQGKEATKSVKSDVQKKILEANATYSDLKNTVMQYDDKYLMGRDKIGYFTDAFKEKWNLGTVTPEEKKELREYTKFKRDAIATLNNYIKQITGAAMSNEEAKRLMKGMPNPGVGLFDGDSPTEFKAKMDGVMQSLDRVVARNNYVNKHGLKSFKEVGLDQMDGIIDERGSELESIIKASKPDISDEELEAEVINALSEEFGIRF